MLGKYDAIKVLVNHIFCICFAYIFSYKAKCRLFFSETKHNSCCLKTFFSPIIPCVCVFFVFFLRFNVIMDRKKKNRVAMNYIGWMMHTWNRCYIQYMVNVADQLTKPQPLRNSITLGILVLGVKKETKSHGHDLHDLPKNNQRTFQPRNTQPWSRKSKNSASKPLPGSTVHHPVTESQSSVCLNH